MRARAALVAALAAAGLGVPVWTGIAPATADPVPPVDPLIPVPAQADIGVPPAADPGVPPPADPAAAPTPPAAPQTLLGQFAQAAQSNPIATMQDLLAASPQQPMLGMAPPPPGSAPMPDPYTMAQALRPQNFRMPTADQVSPYALAPNDNPGPFARIEAFRGVHALTHSNLGRMPGDQLGQPLPGTAPPPGANIPAGLEQFYTPPEAAPAPAAPAPATLAAADAPPPAPPVDPLLLPTAPAPPA